MKLDPFKLERLFAKYEFSTRYLLSPSDCEPLSFSEIHNFMTSDEQNDLLSLNFGYTETSGSQELRDRISELYSNISAKEIIVSAPQELIFLFYHAFLNKNDHVIIVHPHYQSLSEIPKSIGCEIDMWELAVEDSKWHLNIDQLLTLIKSNTKLISVNFPHNPTGLIPNDEFFHSLISICRERGIAIFSDEMYKGLEFDEKFSSLVDQYELAFTLSGLSKSLSSPGLRIGWIACRDLKILSKILRLKDYTTICNSTFSEFFGRIIIKNRDKILMRNIKRIKVNNDLWKSFCESNSHYLSYHFNNGGSTNFSKLTDEIPFDIFFDRMISQHQMMVVGGEMFNFNEQYFRVGLGRKNLVDILEVLRPYFTNK